MDEVIFTGLKMEDLINIIEISFEKWFKKYQESQFEKAEDCYSKAIEINPKRSAKIYKNRAYLREKQNKNSDAKDDLTL